MTVSDEAIALLREILAELRALRQATESKLAQALKRKDREALSRLLPALDATMSDKDFAARELINRAATDPKLREALVHALGTVDSGSARKLGGLLKRAAGIADNGRLVVRLGEDRAGAIWQVTRELRE